MEIIITIIPVFAVIGLGWLVQRKGFIPPEFLGPANRLVYYLAIPAMIFRSISKGSLKTDFNPSVLGLTLLPILLLFLVAWGVGKAGHIRREQFGTFMQSSFHGNLGYIGLAVAFYFLGEKGLASASILAGFIMILQNFLAVVALQLHNGDTSGHHIKDMLVRILNNPVIVSALAGILWSLSGLPLPTVVRRSLDIISNMALPLALLLIGASLSFHTLRDRQFSILSACLMKLILLPGLGILLYRLWGISPQLYLPGLILLASPTATIAYVMAREMNGDQDFAVGAISATTLLSAITFSVWLQVTV
ncbi:transporter [Desulfonema ishimotonii]|uniref:Transporter n=1 Tax=Desulfonema ishimotonii TaxID=45657 RepID=A0A401FYN4_9BACT|nr:AEC family transporter [Desulfonema ishimotonii]GBC62056.1 transporter [Desulfonema ishimotonii]